MGANLKCVSLRPEDGQWQLDMAALKAAITPATRMLIVNSPNNPTGWTLSRAEQSEILAHCRSTGTWVLADEVYERLYYDTDTANGCAPSFSGCGRARGSPGGGAQLFQELFDDRLAFGLVGDACRHDAAHGQADRVQHLLRLGVHPKGGGGGAAKHCRHHATRCGAPQSLPRHPGALAAGCAGRATGSGQRRHVRVFQARRASRFGADCQTLGGRSRAGPGSRRGLCPRGGRLAALVLCVQRLGAFATRR
jgi:hypothetical protein